MQIIETKNQLYFAVRFLKHWKLFQTVELLTVSMHPLTGGGDPRQETHHRFAEARAARVTGRARFFRAREWTDVAFGWFFSRTASLSSCHSVLD